MTVSHEPITPVPSGIPMLPVEEVFTNVPRPRLRQSGSFLRETIETVLLIAAIYTFVNLATARFVVDGHSMLPNFNTDQFIIVSRLSYILGEPGRGDVVVFHYPLQSDRDFIKRVIGLPGETVTIQDSRVYVNGKRLEEPYIDNENWCRGKTCDGEWVVGPEEYFVLGDNRGSSKDSQDFGPINRKYLVGRAFVRYWPPKDWGLIEHESFDEQRGMPLPTITPTPTLTPTPTIIPPETGFTSSAFPPPATPTPPYSNPY
ncbi:MAG: signal peptidase I [Anaerolineae bacterium]|nr:signal peptidase I [Anaerolineae bacterium]